MEQELPLYRAQYRGCFFFYSLPPIQKYRYIFFVVPKSCAVEGGKGVADPCFVLSQGDVLQGLGQWPIFQGAMVVTRYQQLEDGTNISFHCVPFTVGLCPGHRGKGIIRPWEK